MKQLHVAIFEMPLPVLVNPTLSIVHTLVRRGYRVTYITSQRFAEKISALGANVILCPRMEFPFNQTDSGESAPIELQYSNNAFDMASRTLAIASNFFENDAPNFILYGVSAYAGRILAERLHIPAICMMSILSLSSENLRDPIVPETFRHDLLISARQTKSFYKHYGVFDENVPFSSHEPTLYFYSQDLQLSGGGSECCLYAPRCAAEQPCVEVYKSKHNRYERSFLISSSTGYDKGPEYFKMCLDAVSAFKWNVLLAIGRNNSSESIGPLPSNCSIVRGIPLVAVMPYVDFLICLGGMITTMEAMYHGLPLLMLTHGHPEAELYADNSQRHGLGTHLKERNPTVDMIRSAVTQMLNNSQLFINVAKASKVVRRGPGAEEAANWFEDYLYR